jgi:hypothetical protein
MRPGLALAACAAAGLALLARGGEPGGTPGSPASRVPPDDPAFFPVGVWLQDPALAPRYRDLGVNLYVHLWSDPAEEQLRTLREAGMRLICRPTEGALARRNDPAIVAWMQPDEPDSAQLGGPCRAMKPPIPPETVVAEHARLRAADPSRPVFLNLGPGVIWDACPSRGPRANHPEDYAAYARGADILGFGLYPANRAEPEVAGRLELVAAGVDRLRASGGGRKPVWAFLECTTIRDAGRAPAAREVRAEAWMALVHGARGIVWFAHRLKPSFSEAGLLEDAAMAKTVADLNGRIRALAPALNAPALRGAATVASSDPAIPVDVRVARYAGSTFLFAVAMRDAPTRATFAVRGLAGRATVEAIGEGRTLPAADGVFADDFEGYGVHLYRIDGEAAGEAERPEDVVAAAPLSAPAPAGPPTPVAAVPPRPRPALPPFEPRRRGIVAPCPDTDCRGCHADEHARWAASKHAAGAATALLNPRHNAAEMLSDECLRCHAPLQAATRAIGDFVQPLDRKGPWRLVEAGVPSWQGVHCKACHDPASTAAGKLAAFDPARRAHVPVKDSTALCQRCHSASDGAGDGRGSFPTTLGCAGCHPDGIPPPRDPEGSVHHRIACATCHFPRGAEMGLAARGSCVQCHPWPDDMHKDVTALDTTYRSKESRNDIHAIRCGSCHPEGGPEPKTKN